VSLLDYCIRSIPLEGNGNFSFSPGGDLEILVDSHGFPHGRGARCNIFLKGVVSLQCSLESRENAGCARCGRCLSFFLLPCPFSLFPLSLSLCLSLSLSLLAVWPDVNSSIAITSSVAIQAGRLNLPAAAQAPITSVGVTGTGIKNLERALGRKPTYQHIAEYR
jgi:hypothetical protein